MGSFNKLYTLAQKEGIGSASKRIVEHIQRTIKNIQVWLLRYRHGNNIVREIQGSKMELDVTTQPMKADLLLSGTMDPAVTASFRDLLQNLESQNDEIHVFELGAHHGYYSLLAAHTAGSTASIYAVEPAPSNVERIRRNRELNGYENLRVIPGAVGATKTSTEFNIQTKSYKNRIIEENADPTEERIWVDVYPVDSLVDEYDIPDGVPVVIRMDVEYYEFNAIKGMQKLLNSNRPIYIYAEIHYSSTQSGDQAIQELENHGFEIKYISSEGRQEKSEANIEIFASRE